MSEAIPVGNSLRIKWVVAFAAVCVAVILAGAAFWNVNLVVAVSVVVFGGVWFVVALATGMVVLHQQRFVVVTPNGFQLLDRRGVREFHDIDVSTISLATETKYRAGHARALKHTCVFKLEGVRSELIRLVYTGPLHAPDPLEGLRERILHNLHRRAEEQLHLGRSISGSGWTLTLDELSIAIPKGITHVPLEEVAAVDTFDACLCIWKRGAEVAVARIPLGTPNVPVLEKVLHARVDPDAEDADESAPTGLGRLLFVRRAPRFKRFLLYAAVCSLSIATVTAACLVRRLDVALGVLPILGLAWLATGCIAWHVLMVRGKGFFCHQFGIRKQTVLGREVEIRFDELDSFTFQETRQFMKGYYQGTAFSLTFGARGGKSLVYNTTLRKQDEELLYLRETISWIMAREMSRTLHASGTVVWTPGLTLTPHALEYRRWTLLGRRPARLAFDDISGIDLSDSQLRLWVEGRKSPVLTEKTSAENFFPGHVLFTQLLSAPVDEADPEGATCASGGSQHDHASLFWIADDSGANR